MSTTSGRTITVTYSGDVEGSLPFPAASNTLSPAAMSLLTLSSGNNTITLPTGGSTVKGVTIIPPANNTNSLTLKGTTADTGIALHLTDPTSIAVNTTQTTLTVAVTTTVTGVRVVYS